MRVRMQVSIAGSKFSYQPGEVVDLPDKQARQWVSVGHAVKVPAQTPLTDRELNLRDLDAEEVLHHRCVHCARRASYVLRNRPYCPQHYRAEMEA